VISGIIENHASNHISRPAQVHSAAGVHPLLNRIANASSDLAKFTING